MNVISSVQYYLWTKNDYGKLLVGMFDLLPTYENGTEKAGDERATEMPGLG